MKFSWSTSEFSTFYRYGAAYNAYVSRLVAVQYNKEQSFQWY